jgi:hypothetical protein
MTHPEPLASAKTHVHCGSPDCDWGAPLSGFSESELDRCRHEFREHCIERHRLDPKDAERVAWFDLEALTMTLLDGCRDCCYLAFRAGDNLFFPVEVGRSFSFECDRFPSRIFVHPHLRNLTFSRNPRGERLLPTAQFAQHIILRGNDSGTPLLRTFIVICCHKDGDSRRNDLVGPCVDQILVASQ